MNRYVNIMEMSLPVEHISDLGITRVSRWCFNCYLIEGDSGPIVVDAGMPRVADDLEPLINGDMYAAVRDSSIWSRQGASRCNVVWCSCARCGLHAMPYTMNTIIFVALSKAS